VNDARNVVRRRDAALAGHRGDEAAARAALVDDDPAVRSTALAALARMGAATGADVRTALADAAPEVRRRACEVAAQTGLATEHLEPLLDDEDPSVVEVGAWALGECDTVPPTAITSLSRIATRHEDALAREAAVAALGARGDPAGLAAILAATTDKPAVRRRAVLALAPFDGPDVDAALHRALEDRDWQVRDAAELLLRDD